MDDSCLRASDRRKYFEIDMTPMVDFTFLLLIFFMVTASFSLHAAMDFNTATPEDPSPISTANQDKPSVVEVFVSPRNDYRVRTSEEDWVEAPNRFELRQLLAKARAKSSGPEKLLIIAHADCLHKAVIQAMDIAVGLEYKIQIRMSDIEF